VSLEMHLEALIRSRLEEYMEVVNWDAVDREGRATATKTVCIG
jgi:hypothetical protein